MLRAPASVAVHAVFFVVAVVVAGSGCFVLDRADALTPGQADGRVVREDGGAAAFVKVGVDGAAIVRRGGADGRFSVDGLTVGSWVVRLVDDEDGDGLADRGAVRAFALPALPDGTRSGVLLGDITVNRTVTLGGVVVDGAGLPVAGADVVVFRTANDIGVDDADVGTLPSEASTVTDDDGAFVFRGVTPGPVQVFAFNDQLASDALAVASPSRALSLTAVPFGARTANVTVRFGVDLGAGGTDRDEGTDGPGGDVDVWVVPRGAPPTGNATARLPLGATTPLSLSPGVFDVHGVLVQGQGRGVLLGQVAIPDDDAIWGTMLLLARDPCVVGDDVDVDADGVVGLPAVDFETLRGPSTPRRAQQERKRALWVGCGDICLADPSAVCTVPGGERFDCDDDADGQPDVSEDPACLGACGSTDLDLDRACDRLDDDPPCGAVDDDACALRDPVLLPDYLDPMGEGEGEGEGKGGEGEGEGE